MRKFLQWWRTRPWPIRYSTYVVLGYASFCGVENFRAHLAWNDYQQARLSSGVTVDLPDKWMENDSSSSFDSAPFLVDLIAKAYGASKSFDLGDLPDFDTNYEKCLQRNGFILHQSFPFETCFPALSPPLSDRQAAARILELTQRWSDELAAFSEAAGRSPGSPLLPASDSTTDLVDAFGSFVPVADLRDFSLVLELRAHAHLKLDDPETALREMIDMLRFSKNLAHRGSFIDTTLASVMTLPVRELTWLGLKQQRWNHKQLQRLADELASVDFLAWNRWAICAEGERVVPFFATLDAGPIAQFHRNQEFPFFNPMPLSIASHVPAPLATTFQYGSSALFGLMPRGWARRNEIHFRQALDYGLQILAEEDPHRRARLVSLSRQHHDTPKSPYTFLTDVFLVGLGAYSEGAWNLEPGLRLMKIAVALELFRMDHGSYPQALAELGPYFPQGVPIDPYSAAPLRYVADNDGQPVVYSLGSNLADDGGVANESDDDGDIVWSYSLP